MAVKLRGDELTRTMQDLLSRKRIGIVVARSMNKSLAQTRTEASKRIRSFLRLKAADVKDAMAIKKARAATSLEKVSGSLEAHHKGVPLYKFGAKPRVVRTARGKRIGVTVNKSGKRSLVTGGFIATVGKGRHTGIFKRVPGTRMRGKKKEKIREEFSTSVHRIFGKPVFLLQVQDFARKTFQRVFVDEANFELGKVKGKKAS